MGARAYEPPSQPLSVVIALRVARVHEALEWYTTLLGRAPDRRLSDRAYQFRLHDKTWLELAAGSTGTRPRLHLEVGDTRAWRDRHTLLGLRPGPLRVQGDLRYYSVADPVGNAIVPFEVLRT